MTSFRNLSFFVQLIVFLTFFCGGKVNLQAQMQKLKISDNNRFLVKEDGSPFVWIGETNWFFAKLPPETIDKILDKRGDQGFTILFVSCREKLYNGEGPGAIDQPNEKWWAYLDEYIDKCEKHNMYVGITLGWWGKTKSHSADELYRYGKWVGNRYKNTNNIVWLTLGEAGSHFRKSTLPSEKLYALVNGIRDGDTGDKLLTIHADYKRGTSLSSDGDFCDFNNWQTSQWASPADLPKKDERNWTVWEAMEFDYNKLYNGKPKPTLDSEAWYENNKDFCGASTFEIRRRAYFTIFAGAFGHTYGAGGIWDGLNEKTGCSGSAKEAINYQGAEQLGFLSQFLHQLGNNFLNMRPAQHLILEGNSNDYNAHIQAMLSIDNNFAVIYSASDSEYTIEWREFGNPPYTVSWYNPRTNEHLEIEEEIVSGKRNTRKFDPPGDLGAGNDWVLVVKRKK